MTGTPFSEAMGAEDYVTFDQFNDLRTDVLDISYGHDHSGSPSRGRLIAISTLSIDASKDWNGKSLTNVLSIVASGSAAFTGTAHMTGKMRIPVGADLFA